MMKSYVILDQLRRAQVENGTSISKVFNLSESKYDASAEFYIFGTSDDQSEYAIWLKAPYGEPVVYFGVKGLVKVITPSISIFLSLLADGRHDPMICEHGHGDGDHGHPHQHYVGAEWFKEFLEEQKIAYPIIYSPTFYDLQNQRALLKRSPL